MRTRRWAVAVSFAPAALGLLALRGTGGEDLLDPRREAAAIELTTTTAAPVDPVEPPTTAAPEPTTTTAPPATTTTAAPEPVLQAAAARDLTVYTGLGTWIDVYDWSRTFGKDGPLVELADIDRMAASGVQTLYVQTSKWDSPTDILEPERLVPLIGRAKQHGMAVVAWYLPTFEDPATDMHRLMESARLPGVDALAVDIESLKVSDVDERNRRLVEISTNLRAALPHVTLGGIPYPPVVTDVINPNLWPRFPWRELAPLYDVWLPMSYHTDRRSDSGYRDGYRYTAENIDRMRAQLGLPDAPVHTIGGIADRVSPQDVRDILRAAGERGALGGSLYDWRTTSPELWPHLQPFRNPARG
jgi:hypothetical protein